MKTSNYIIILFLIFLFGTLTALHIDSKLYEPIHKEREAERKRLNKIRSPLISFLLASQKDQPNMKKWNAFITEAKSVLSKDDFPIHMFAYPLSHIVYRYKIMGQTELLPLAKSWIEKSLDKNPNDIQILFLYSTVLFESGNTLKAIEIHKKANKLNQEKSNKPYNQHLAKVLKRYISHLNDKELKIEDKYLDLPATDLNNNLTQLSQIVNNNEVTLINFWSPMSSASTNSNRKLFPLYYEYKNRGFTIISLTETHEVLKEKNKILQEFKDLVETENYPWTTLIDVDKENRVWDRYGVLDTYSRNILIDKKGIILAIDPTEEELKALLNKHL